MWITIYDDSEQGIVIKNRDGIARILFAQLEYIEVINKAVFFHLVDGTVQKITAALDSRGMEGKWCRYICPIFGVNWIRHGKAIILLKQYGERGIVLFRRKVEEFVSQREGIAI